MKNNELIYKKISFILLICMLFSFTACGKGGTNDSSVSSMTLAEEMAGDISENVVPMEATIYTKIEFNIPDGMVEDTDNTDTKAFYLSASSNDLSFVAYQRRDNSGKITYDTMTEEDFKSAFLDQLGVSPNIRSFDKEIKDGYFKISINLGYSVAGIGYACNEYIFVTDEYIFTVTYCQDSRTDWHDAFKNSVDSISLVSVVGSKLDRLTPGELVVNDEVPEEDVVEDKEDKENKEDNQDVLDNKENAEDSNESVSENTVSDNKIL